MDRMLHQYISDRVHNSWFIAAILIWFLGLSQFAFAQTHVANPFVGATQYVNPDYANEINQGIAAESSQTNIQKMNTVKTYPTAVWMDHIAAINGDGGRLGLQAHLNAALQQRQGTTPIVFLVVIYDLPDRDCAARASNGELTIAANPPTQPLSGLDTYKQQYIDQIMGIFSNPAYSNVRIVAIIEPDSLPNLVTNAGGTTTIQACVDAKNSGVYVQGIQYAITQLHTLPNAYIYLDIGHSGWLGWDNNMQPAITLYHDLVNATPSGLNTIDGFVTDTANTLPTREPFMTANQTVGGQPVFNATFYQFNPFIDEASYAQELYNRFVTAGFPSSIGMLIDTSRNGWGGPARPAGPSSSTDLNTFVNATKIDRRAHRGLWCNPVGAGIGAPPQAAPAGFFSALDAFVWVKPPGESDGTYPGSANQDGALHADPNCDPAQTNPLAGNTPTGAYPNSPPAGSFFVTQFHDLVVNAFPPIPTSTNPDFSMSATSASVMQASTGTSTITVSPVNSFSGNVGLTVSNLPSGVTATFSPTSVTGGNGVSTLTFTATASATVGQTNITVTGASGSLTHSISVPLNVVGKPEFSISVSPTSLMIPLNGSSTATATVTSLFGFTGTVSFSSSGVPSGVILNFGPSSVNGSGTSNININVQSGATQGTFPISITGTSGSLVHSATLTLTVGSGGIPDYSLAATPNSFTVNRGASGTSNIAITRLNGFASAVAFTASGLPTGVTASFNPQTTTTTGNSSVLTLTASSTATLGVVTVTVSGTGGGLTRTTTLTLTVANPGTPDFSMAASPATLSVAQGASGTSTITITRLNGFASTVAFTATGLPSGVTATFNPQTTTTSGTSSVVTFAASSTAPAATAVAVTITGTGGSLARTTTVSLTVTTGGGTGGVTVTPVVSTNSPWFNEEQVQVANTGAITAMSLTVAIQRTTGISFGGQYNTVGTSITQSNTSTPSTVTYTFNLAAGQSLSPGSYTFAAQTSGTGTAHATTGDTWTMNYTTGGQNFTQSGHF